MISQTFTILNPTGFHARPAKTFVLKANEFPCKINLIKADKKVNGKSTLSLLTLGIATNDQITVEADGEQEEQAVAELGALLEKIFVE